MRSFLRYFLLFLVVIITLNIYLPIRYGTPYPAQPGPKFTDTIDGRHILLMNKKHVRIALVGDSALKASVDPETLSTSLEIPSHVISIPGSTSAFWYLVIKNLILETEKKPDYIIIFFRDTILTVPNFHVNGGYVHEIDEYATSHEEVLLERAYLNFINPLEKWALAWFPLYRLRAQLTGSVDYYARNMLPSLFMICKRDCLDRANAVIFQAKNLQKEFRTAALVGEQDILYTRQAMDFKAQIDSSFLPLIIHMVRENGLHLILVHERTLLFPSLSTEPEALHKYKADLAAYLKENNVILLDYSHDPRLPIEYYSDPIHMDKTGKTIFTQILAEALRSLMQTAQ